MQDEDSSGYFCHFGKELRWVKELERENLLKIFSKLQSNLDHVNTKDLLYVPRTSYVWEKRCIFELSKYVVKIFTKIVNNRAFYYRESLGSKIENICREIKNRRDN